MKRVIFVILLVLLTGCSVNYNITIDKNLSISESVTMCEKEDFFTPYYNSTKDRIINNIYSVVESDLKNNGYNAYNFKSDDNKDACYGKRLENKYNNLEEYIKNKLLVSQFWDSIDYEERDDVITIKTVGNFSGYVEQNPDKYIVEDATISIKLPFDVTDTNGDCTKNNNVNVCKWYINKDTKDLNLYITFSTSSLKEEKENVKNTIVNKSIIKYICYGIIGIILLVVIIKFLSKNISRNKM